MTKHPLMHSRERNVSPCVYFFARYFLKNCMIYLVFSTIKPLRFAFGAHIIIRVHVSSLLFYILQETLRVVAMFGTRDQRTLKPSFAESGQVVWNLEQVEELNIYIGISIDLRHYLLDNILMRLS